MSTIIRPKKQQREGVRRPAWLYPEGTILSKKEATYKVVRNYGTSAVEGLVVRGTPVTVQTRSARFWKEV